MAKTRVGVVGPCELDDFAANIIDGLNALKLDAVPMGSVLRTERPRVRSLGDLARRDRRLGPVLERHLVRAAVEAELELVITVVSLRPETIRSMKSAGIKTALWFPDAVANLGALWMFDAPYSGLFFKEPHLVRRLTDTLELPVHYLPEACNPTIHRPVEGGPAAGHVVVVGNLHPIRVRLLEQLVRDGIPLSIYGNPSYARLATTVGAHTGRYVRGPEKSAIFRSASAVLNNMHPAEVEGVNCRVFEAAGAGAYVVSEFRPELPSFFRLGEEMTSYNNYGELLVALRTALTRDESDRSVGDLASYRAHAEHTYERRLGVLMERVS